MVLTADEATAALTRLGWRIRSREELTQAATSFQKGWNLGEPIDPIGVIGPRTSEGLRISLERQAAGRGTASEHFSFSEFACTCDGRFADCPRIWVLRTHLQRLEDYRARVGGPVTILSGCRCVRRNREVGGASSSQHLFGAASDVKKRLSTEDVRSMQRFAGIGRSRRTNLVAHVDSRDASGHNTTGGTPGAPTIWDYA